MALTGPNRVRDAVALVTGGTGSFSSVIVRRLLRLGARQVRVLSRDETKQHEMRTALSDDRVKFYLRDVRSRESVDRAMSGVELVFHAAALKQVPSSEFFPMEAVQTNIIGSHNVIESAHTNNVSSVVCLGTDKAAYPINAMGMTKALMEKTAQAFARNYPGAMTNMTRFLMSLDDAVDLVEHAFTCARPGDLFVKKAPACTVEVLATAVAELLDREPKIGIVGTRHGEKLDETLATREKLSRADDLGGFFRVAVDARNLNYSQYFDEGDERASAGEDYHSHNTQRLDLDDVRSLLAALPEFQALVGAGVRR